MKTRAEALAAQLVVASAEPWAECLAFHSVLHWVEKRVAPKAVLMAGCWEWRLAAKSALQQVDRLAVRSVRMTVVLWVATSADWMAASLAVDSENHWAGLRAAQWAAATAARRGTMRADDSVEHSADRLARQSVWKMDAKWVYQRAVLKAEQLV